MSKTNVAIYTRVSTKGQDYQRQIGDLKSYAASQGYNVVATISEKISGGVRTSEKPGLQKLFALCEQGVIQKVLISEISRLGRRTSEVLQVIEHLTELKISVYAHNYRLETLTPKASINPVAQLLFTFLAEFSRLEREMLKERIMSGLNHAKRLGKVLGRPTGSTIDPKEFQIKYKGIIKRLNSGYSIREIAKLESVAVNTVQKVKRSLHV